MYVCTCVCIHVHVCHAYIVCHEYIDTCIYLFVVHLDIFLLVVSDGDDSTKGWKSLFENPGVIEVHELFVYSENHSLVHKSSNIPLTLWGENRVCCFGVKKIVTSIRSKIDLYPKGGTCFFFGLISTQVACRVQPKRTHVQTYYFKPKCRSSLNIVLK